MIMQHNSPFLCKGDRKQFASFVGVDLHKTSVTLGAVNIESDKIGLLTTDTKCINKIEAWINSLPKPCWLAVEAVGFCEWFIDRFRDSVDRIDIADATALASLRGKRRKTDKKDSLDVAKRLAQGSCPLGFIASPELMRLRKLGRHWRRLSRTMSRAKHGMKSILNAANIRGPKFDGASAQKWLLAHGHLLKAADHDAFSDMLDVVMLIERQRERLRRKIIFENRSDNFSQTIELLKTIPGIDEIWACIIAAEVGPFNRFPNADALEFWAGLTPDNKETAGRTQSGSITKAGSSTLRWALCNAGVTMCKSDAKQAAIRNRLIARIGKPKTNTAMGRRLLGIIFAMMRDNKPYQRGEPLDRLAKANQAKNRKYARKEASMSS